MLLFGEWVYNLKNNLFLIRYNEQFNKVLFSKVVAISIYPVAVAYLPETYSGKIKLHSSEDYVFVSGYTKGWRSTTNSESGYLSKIYLNDPIVVHEVSLDVNVAANQITRFYDIELT